MEVQAALERIPLFVPAGGIIPQGKVMRYMGAEADDLRQAYIFPRPRRGLGNFKLIEDDGLSLTYQRGGYAEVGLEREPGHPLPRISASVFRFSDQLVPSSPRLLVSSSPLLIKPVPLRAGTPSCLGQCAFDAPAD